MIQYALKCADGHAFDSWFQSADAFDKLVATGMVACAICGSGEVSKAIMTPSVRPSRKAKEAPVPAEQDLRQPASQAEAALREIRRQVDHPQRHAWRELGAAGRQLHGLGGFLDATRGAEQRDELVEGRRHLFRRRCTHERVMEVGHGTDDAVIGQFTQAVERR